MRLRQWLLTALAGVAGFTLAASVAFGVYTFRQEGRVGGAASIGGPFTLVDDNGLSVTDKTLAGKPYVIYFGYTYCPDFCPTTLLDLSRWIKKLGPDADKLNYVFVSIDPERDKPELLHRYLSSFDEHIRGFTGTPEQIAKIAREYRVYYKKISQTDGTYVMDHSAIMYLMRADGVFNTIIAYQEDDASSVAKLKKLMAPTPTS
jgi:protein SCO1